MKFFLFILLSFSVLAATENNTRTSDEGEDEGKIWQEAQKKIEEAEKKRNEAIEEAKKKTNFVKHPNPEYVKAYQDIWDQYAKDEKDLMAKLCKDAPGVCPSQADRNAREASIRIAKSVESIKAEWAGNKSAPSEKFETAKERVLKEVRGKCEKPDFSAKFDNVKKNAFITKENKCLQDQTDALKTLCANYTSKEESGCNESAFKKLADESAAQMCQFERIYRIDAGIITGTEVKALREKIVTKGKEEWDSAKDPKCDSLLESDEGPVIEIVPEEKPAEKPAEKQAEKPVAKPVDKSKEEPKRETASVPEAPKEEPKPEVKPTVVVAEGDDKISRYKTSECKWVDDLPKKIVYGPSCGKTPTRMCTGYVICPAKDATESTPLFVRQATCRAEYCADGKARNCVEDLSYYSRKPSKDEKVFASPELKEYLKGRGSHQ